MTGAAAGGLTRVAAGLSVLLTPWLLFVTSSHELYVRNQEELGRQVDVLAAFWGAFAAVLLLGLGLRARRARPWARSLLWAYYLAGVFFLAMSFLRGLPLGDRVFLRFFDTVPGVGVLLAGFGLALILCARRSPERVAVPLGLLGLLIALGDAARLAPRITWAAAAEMPPLRIEPRGASSRGNVYHVIFDALQADLVEAILAGRDPETLRGCVTFPRARSLSSSTRESLPHVFTGGRLPEAPTPEERLHRALNDPAVSVLEPLRQSGVATIAFVPRSAYPPTLDLFDVVRFHDENVRAEDLREMNRVTLRRLWLFSALPIPLAAAPWRRPDAFETFEGDALRRADNQRALSYSAPIASYLGFRKFLEQEPALPAGGRYTFIHVLVPHVPLVLGPDCAYDPLGRRTGTLEQFGCASRMLLDLLSTLQRLGRYDTSLILVHGDHGVRLRLDGGRLVRDDDALLRPFLMVKAPGAGGPRRASPAESTLLDVAPTVLDWLGRPPGPSVEGRSLLARLPAP